MPILALLLLGAVFGAGFSIGRAKARDEIAYTVRITHRDGLTEASFGRMLAVWGAALAAEMADRNGPNPIVRIEMFAPDGTSIRTWPNVSLR